MSETKESARRWSGYVCPDCRLVFRVPRDHDGLGVVCQNCRRLLRIPAAGEPTPPLVAESLNQRASTPVAAADATAEASSAASADEPVPHHSKHRVRKRRTHTNSGDETAHPSWEHEGSGLSKLGRRDRRAMAWMLGGGLALLALIAGGMMVAWHEGGNIAAKPPPPTPAPPVLPAVAEAAAAAAAEAAAQAALPALQRRSVPSILAEAEPLARKFLEARTVDELLPLVRQPERARPRMLREYPQGRIDPPGLALFNATGNVALSENVAMVDVRTRNFENRQLSLVPTPAGLMIDWESWVGWSDMTWPDLLAALPTEATQFRLVVKRVEYYNFGFSDDKQWQSYRLESRDGEHMIFGYVQRGSSVAAKLQLNPDAEHTPMILKIRFPAGVAASNNQVVIDDVVANGWVEQDQ